MDGQRQRTRGRRRRKSKPKKKEAAPKTEPVFIVARRPDSPRVKTPSRNIAASARPKRSLSNTDGSEVPDAGPEERGAEKPRRAARIVSASAGQPDDFEATRQRLLARLLLSEGRSAITRATNALDEQEIPVPEEQELQLQLLEHVDERRARAALQVMARLLNRQAPVKRPILERRLRRLEQEADEEETREQAAALRRSLRAT